MNHASAAKSVTNQLYQKMKTSTTIRETTHYPSHIEVSIQRHKYKNCSNQTFSLCRDRRTYDDNDCSSTRQKGINVLYVTDHKKASKLPTECYQLVKSFNCIKRYIFSQLNQLRKLCPTSFDPKLLLKFTKFMLPLFRWNVFSSSGSAFHEFTALEISTQFQNHHRHMKFQVFIKKTSKKNSQKYKSILSPLRNGSYFLRYHGLRHADCSLGSSYSYLPAKGQKH